MIVPVLLSGGSGTRLWPLSRKHYPKQFLKLVNEKTLFQDTIKRLPNNTSNPLIICNEEHRFIVAEQLRQIKSSNNGIILEPVGKNTAPAIAIAAISLLSNEEDPILLVLSADHLISDNKKFLATIEIAINIAKKDKLVTLGIEPNKPATGYGYIEVDKSKQEKYYNILSFTEKPSLEIAEQYYKSACHYWNSGIFIFKASVYLNELRKFEPEIYSVCKKSFNNEPKDIDFIRLDQKEFNKCPNKSIDYAVMERTNIGAVVPYTGDWNDVGSWEDLWQSKVKDLNNNVSEGDVILSKVSNSYIHSTNRLIAANDIDNLVIIDTQDSLLISSKSDSQNIREIVKSLNKNNRTESDYHRKVYRPWGHYDSIDSGLGFQVKRIFVNPGAKLSLQKHNKRAEHWVVVRGVALITCGERKFQLKENQSTYVPKGEIHRLENTQKKPLEIIEIQTGSYLEEDDIIRIEDDYHRK
jgi:mannose-1-phosphate guanylyltransferase